MNYCKSHPLTNKKANIKTHKYGVAILMYGLRYLTFYMIEAAFIKQEPFKDNCERILAYYNEE